MKLSPKVVTAVVATSFWLSFAAGASALTFDFSFTNPTAPETVMGVVTGLVDNATSPATSVQVTDWPPLSGPGGMLV